MIFDSFDTFFDELLLVSETFENIEPILIPKYLT